MLIVSIKFTNDTTVVVALFFFMNFIGMEEVSLITFLIKNRILTQVVFPTGQERIIPAERLLEHTRFEEEDVSESNKTTAMFFRSYIKEIAEKKEGTACTCL